MNSIGRLLTVPILLLSSGLSEAAAQVYYGPIPKNLEISPFAGYMVNTDIRVTDGYVSTTSGPDFGVAFNLDLKKASQLEVFYVAHQSRSGYRSNTEPANNFEFNILFQYFMVGYSHEMRPLKMNTPFFSVGLGGWWAKPDFEGAKDTWRVAMYFGGGWKFYFSEVIGIRVQAQALFPIVFSGGGLYVGTGGSGLAITAGIPIAQFSFSGGLIFVI